MEWLVMFLAIALVVGAVIWLADRARSARRSSRDEGRDEAAGDPDRRPGPRHVDVAAVEDGDSPGDAGP